MLYFCGGFMVYGRFGLAAQTHSRAHGGQTPPTGDLGDHALFD